MMDWPSEDSGNSATVFIRGLPYTWTDLDLSAHFEHIGPVRRSFVISQKHTNISKGFGFVQFALPVDAQTAVDQMDGKEVGDGRRLRVEMAVERGKEEVGGTVKGAVVGEKRKGQTKADAADTKRQKVDRAAVKKEQSRVAQEHKAEQKRQPEVLYEEEEDDGDSETSDEEDEGEDDQPAATAVPLTGPVHQAATPRRGEINHGLKQLKEEERTSDVDATAMTDDRATPTPLSLTASHALLVSGIPPSATSLDDVLKQHSLRPTLVVFPAPESTLRKKAARLTFPSASLASHAASLLTSITMPAASTPLRCVALPINAARVIVRNLPFHIGEPQLRKLLSPFGAIESLLVPAKEQSSGEAGVSRTLNRGFGFVCYLRMEDAASMMAAVNGKLQWGRRLAVDWSLDKQQYDARLEMARKKEKLKDVRKEKRKAKTAGAEGQEDEDDDAKVKKEEDDDGEGADGDEDVVMVKEENDAAEGSTDMDEDEGDEEYDDAEGEHDESESDEHGDDEKSSDDEAAPLSPASSTASSSSSTSPRTKPTRAFQSTDSDADCTLFIRNLAYETTEQALFDKFSLFGKVKYARVVMERVAADKHDEEDDEKESMQRRSKGVAFVRFYNKVDADRVLTLCQSVPTTAGKDGDRRLPSMVTLSENGIVLDNRQLNVVRAVDKRQASQLTAVSNQKLDKRNLYLAREGVILPSSAGAAGVMSEDELKRRERYYREKKRKLDNPNFMVSRVRLSLRNLPLECDEKQVKRTLMAAVKLGRREERQREREEMRRAEEAEEYKKDDEDKKKRRREAATAREAIRRTPIVMRQVKVVRDNERAGAGGLGRSKRYGFIEFSQHETALTALRTINAHSELWKEVGGVGGAAGGRVMVEFAVDDVRKVKERDERQRRLEKMRDIKAKMLADKEKAVTVGVEAADGEEKIAVTAKDRKRQAREAGVCYKCGEAGHQAKKCKQRRATAKAEGEVANGVHGVKGETMTAAERNGQSKVNGGRAKSARANQSATNGHVASASKKRESSDVEQQSATQHTADMTAKATEAEPAAVNGTTLLVGAGKRKREERPQQQLSKREKRELAGEAKFEAMVSEYKKKFLDVEQPIASTSGGTAARGEEEKQAPKSRWFDIDGV